MKLNTKTRETVKGFVFIIMALLLFSVPTFISYHPNNIAGSILVSRSSDIEDKFYRTVIFVAKHDKLKAIGYVINKPKESLKAQEIFDKLDIKPAGYFTNIISGQAYAETFINSKLQKVLQTYWGGPIDEDKFHLIFTDDRYTSGKINYIANTGVKISDDKQAINNILELGDKVRPYKIVMGYAGWGIGQLDQELAQGSWWVIPYDYKTLFTDSSVDLWDNLAENIHYYCCDE